MIGVLIIPIVASLSEDAIYAVPEDFRKAAYALGARKIDVVFRVIVPAALSGIFASIILAFTRAMGDYDYGDCWRVPGYLQHRPSGGDADNDLVHSSG